ncbi:hypothetical protein GC163_24145 [bacterium]|nr:hypothetical protein [bacterium]
MTSKVTEHPQADAPEVKSGRPPIILMGVGLVLALVAIWWFLLPTKPAAGTEPWGFARVELLNQSVSRDQYLENLALAIDDWAPRVPEDRGQLRSQLAEFHRHYAAVSTLDHTPLTAEDRIWLHGKLTLWGSVLDRRARDIEVLELPFEHVKRQTAQTLRKMANSLRFRAKSNGPEPAEMAEDVGTESAGE